MSAIRRFLKYRFIWKSSWYIALWVGVRYLECPLKEVPLYTVTITAANGIGTSDPSEEVYIIVI